MTLAEVARNLMEETDHSGCCPNARAVRAFESDPDFTLRSRIEKLAEECGRASVYGPLEHRELWIGMERRLREVLKDD